MKYIVFLFTLFTASSLSFAQDDDYICSKLTKEQGFAGLVLNSEIETLPDFVKVKTDSPVATTCVSCLEDGIEVYSVAPASLEMETIYGLDVDQIELFYQTYNERYTLIGIAIQINLPQDEELVGDFQAGLFNDYFPILDTYGITERGERLQWLGGGSCGILMSIDMSFRLEHYKENGLKTIEWVFESACGG